MPIHIRILLAACLLLPALAHARCPLTAETPAALSAWKAAGFAIDEPAARQARALALAHCLGDPDPFLRDGIAFEALSTWMRGRQLDATTLRLLQADLLAQLEGADDAGFRKPFAALVLSEVARTDRVQPWMTAGERERTVAGAATYLRGVRDYRGYVDGEGWRHGVAHGADWALQLALNRQVSPAQLMPLLAAVGAQVMPVDGHAYAFGEPTRLARPVAYAVARGDLDQAATDAWLAGLIAELGALPKGDRQATWWARRANLENFLHALALMVQGEQSPALTALSVSVGAALQKLP
jgi:hypothetical protein